jgi:GNAT superfamily N-acetyltransferase
MPGDLVRRVLAVNQALLALGNESFEVEGATFVRNLEAPSIRDSNHIAHVRARTPAEIDSLLARVEREYAAVPHRRFDMDLETPPEFEARLALEGYRSDEALVLLLEGELLGETKPCDIRLVQSDADWAAYAALHAIDWRDYSERLGREEEPEVGAAMMGRRRAKTPPVRWWLACVDGEPRAYFSSWEGTDGVGQIEDLFTHPDFRHRGLATALIHHSVADSRAHGAGPVVIIADPTDTPKQMYAAMGFHPIAVRREWWKNV